MMKLAEFKEKEILIGEQVHYVETMNDVKELIREIFLESNGFVPEVYTVSSHKIGFNAKEMIEDYLESEAQWEDQDERCMDEFTEDDFKVIQDVLDRVSKSKQFNFYEIEQEIDCSEFIEELREQQR